MIRNIAIAAFGAILLGSLPAHAQDMPELDGAPGPLNIPKPAPVQPKPAQPKPSTVRPAQSKPVATKTTQPKPVIPAASTADAARLKATEDRLAKQADAQATEAARLSKLAADLNTRQASLDARAAAIDADEKRLAGQETALVAKQAELDRKLADASKTAPDRQLATRDDALVPPLNTQPGRTRRDAGLDLAAAKRSCMLEAQSEARARNFFSASYDTEPRLNQRTMELRGLMRLDDRRGYRLVDTVCELSPDGEAEYIDFLR